jgi:hypothetical protein
MALAVIACVFYYFLWAMSGPNAALPAFVLAWLPNIATLSYRLQSRACRNFFRAEWHTHNQAPIGY